MFVMARRKDAEREAARRLRADGWSLRRIARHLGVSLASVSVWTRGVEQPAAVLTNPPIASENVRERRCGRCHRTLPETDFHRWRGRRRGWCKECRAEYIRQRGDVHRQQTYAARERRRAAARAHVLAVLASSSCVDCGLADALVLEFDHVGTKSASISALVHEGYRLSRIEKELECCELVCANCHRRRTALRARSWRIDPEGRAAGADRPLRRRNLRFLVEHLREASCVDCGARDHLALEFDHVGAKRASVVWLAFQEHSIVSLEAEMSQCEIRCANCHRRRTIRDQPDHLRHHLLQPP
jgi:hypothetical protein